MLCTICLGHYEEGGDFLMHQVSGNCPPAPFDIRQIEAAYLAEDRRIAEEIGDRGGHDFVICTKIALFLQKLIPNNKVVGFSEEDNPHAAILTESGADGHDFLLVANRYIVDFWGRDVAGLRTAPVAVDLKKDSWLATKWYGERKLWKNLEDSF